jgi:hypothetical protein
MTQERFQALTEGQAVETVWGETWAVLGLDETPLSDPEKRKVARCLTPRGTISFAYAMDLR